MGKREVVQREVVQRSHLIIRLFLLCCRFIAVFFSLQLMWLQLVIESADFHPDTHARETVRESKRERAHTHTRTHTVCPRFWPVQTELILNAGTYDSTRIDFLVLWFHSGLCRSSQVSVRPLSHIPGREQGLAVGYNAESLTRGGNERQSVDSTLFVIGQAGEQVPRKWDLIGWMCELLTSVLMSWSVVKS